ncbi:metallo-beta-lactamase domain-containing protein 1 isoform X2 [Arctopsyche grandis]|uniref:metallo-beta-lactamase domain-containing protein 1 isoform X2 n=1 Tax=Arctopsyche grandis TaxID=121162 RepID=UPI00406D7206
MERKITSIPDNLNENKEASLGFNIYVLYNGYSSLNVNSKTMKANCTCTLIKGPSNIIVDTMTPWDKDKIIKGLNEHNLMPEDINYVINSHGHSDHIGNNNLFLKAMHIVGLSVSIKDVYYLSAFENGASYKINDDIEIIPTPGHTLSDVTTIVKTLNKGLCAVTGDLFECKEDIDKAEIWMEAGSESPERQKYHRFTIANMVDWIFPGHGEPFESTLEVRGKLKQQLQSSFK